MATILDAVLPLFAVILAGFAAGRLRLLDGQGVKALVTFVFTFAMPPLLFRLVAGSDVVELLHGGFLVSHLGAQAIAALLGAALGWHLLRLDAAAVVILGFGCAFPNSVLLGLPLMLTLFGERGGVPATLIFVLNVVMYSLVTLLLQLTRQGQGRLAVWALLRSIGGAIVTNPVIMAALCGLAWLATGLSLPPLLDRMLGFIGSAGPPTALFALGASLGVAHISLRPTRPELGAVGIMVLCKLALHPLAAYVLAVPVLGIEPFFASAVVIMAALPIGANVYVFAQHYDVAVQPASTAILISTGLAMLSVPLVLWWMMEG